MSYIISLDTETTGIDLNHGARPFLTSICDSNGVQHVWHSRISARLRKVIIPRSFSREIQEHIDSADEIVFQNARFDIRAIQRIGVRWTDSHWAKTRDIIIGDHLIDSGREHDLGTQSVVYLKKNIDTLFYEVQSTVKEARDYAKKNLPEFRLAIEGDPMLPSAKADNLKFFDYWVPREVAIRSNFSPEHRWHGLIEEYNLMDTAVTMAIYKVQTPYISEAGLDRLYSERMALLRTIYLMEEKGVTYSKTRLKELLEAYKAESKNLETRARRFAPSMGEFPKTGMNNHLRRVLFEEFKLPVVKRSKKSGEPSGDKEALGIWLATIPRHKPAYKFVECLAAKRKRDTAISYMESYDRVRIDLNEEWAILYPSLNPTGTATLRFSSSNPNEQNISKKEGFNLRYCFGPPPGFEWWALDYENVELRIPAYEAGETLMIDLFENPDKPPYFGSNHLLVAHILHPKEFEECLRTGESFKNKYKSTLYQWTKNGNFAVQYGAIESSGTADRAYHVPGGQRRIQEKFKKISELNQRMITFANRNGYVETIPDRSLGMTRGYPLTCEFVRKNEVRPTVPLNYHVQGTAMWAMCRAMNRCQDYLDSENVFTKRLKSKVQTLYQAGYTIVMQVHDELVFCMPYRKNHGNLKIVRRLKQLMERSGDDIGVPLKVSVTYHPNNWSEGEDIKL